MLTNVDIGTEEKILVVAELGAANTWTASNQHGNLVVISQVPEEPPDAFAVRTARRIGRLIGTSWYPRTVILAVGSESGETALSARVGLIRALLVSLPTQTGDLVLATSAGFTHAAQRELCTLAQILAEGTAGLIVRIESPVEAPSFTAGPSRRGQEFILRTARHRRGPA